MNSIVRFCLPVLAGLFTLNTGTASTFVGLGQLPNGNYSYSDTISGDGSTVVGVAVIGATPQTSGASKAYAWTASGGMQSLGSLPNREQSYSYGVSFDGSVVVGASTSGGFGSHAFRWTAGSGMVDLGTLPGGQTSGAHGTNRDGSVVVGTGGTESGGLAFRWTASGGMISLGVVPSGRNSVAEDVSDSGAVVVGSYQITTGQSRAFRWDENTGMVSLETLSGGENGDSLAAAISGNGNVIVGTSLSILGSQAFRWTASTGMVGLGILSGTSSSSALAADSDGSTIVGMSDQRAFLWDATFGMQDLQGLLATEYGLSSALSDWQLTAATGISDDGLTISGYGQHNGVAEAWIATIPEPSTAVLCVSVLAPAFLARSRERARKASLH